MSDVLVERKGFIRSCLGLFFYGYNKCTTAWLLSIVFASAGVVLSAVAVIALTLAIVNGPELLPTYKQYQSPFSYAEIFYFVSVAGIASYMLTFTLEAHFSSVVKDFGQVSNLAQRKVDRQRTLVRILACRVKYLVAPYLFMFLTALGLAIVKKQYAALFLTLLVSILVASQNRERVSKFASTIFTDRAMTPLRLGLSRLIVVVIAGGLVLAFQAYFNFFSLLVIMTSLALAIHLIRCWNLYNKIKDFL